MKKFKVGLIGLGAIGSKLKEFIQKDKEMDLIFVFDIDEKKTKKLGKLKINSLEQGLKRKPDLIIEAASHEAVKEYGENILNKTDLMIISIGALADDNLNKKLQNTCKKTKNNLYITTGAIIGLDGIRSVKSQLKEVLIETKKHPKSLSLDNKKTKILYNGSAKKACKLFPKNVNVAATLSLNGIGLNKTRVRIVSDPNCKVNSHTITASGDFGKFTIKVEATKSSNPKTSALTALSAFEDLKRIQKGNSLY